MVASHKNPAGDPPDETLQIWKTTAEFLVSLTQALRTCFDQFACKAAIQILGAILDELVTLTGEEVVRPGIVVWVIVIPFWVFSLSTRACTSFGGATLSWSPWMMRPDEGQGRGRRNHMYSAAVQPK